MLDWPNESTGRCACIFERKEYCGIAEPVEWCAFHAKLRDALINIAWCYENRAELYSSDEICAGVLADKAKAALVPNELSSPAAEGSPSGARG